MPTNFKSYEAQSRLLAAVIASQPGLKLNFRAIALHFGSDTTPSAIEHRFRPIRKHVSALRQAVAQGKDARELAPLITMHDKDIHKYYGESTPQGLEFQFRAIKKDAKALKDAADHGQNPLTTTLTTTPRKRKSPATKDNGDSSIARGRKRTATPSTSRNAPTNDEDDASEVDYDLLDLTPTNTPTKKRAATTTTAAASSEPASGGTTPAYPLSSWSAVFQAPVTPTSAVAYVPDTTPALTVGATPPEPHHEENDDDDIYIIETPSKAPAIKLEKKNLLKTEPRFAADAADDENEDWNDGYFPAHSQPTGSFTHMSFSQSTSFFDNDGAV